MKTAAVVSDVTTLKAEKQMLYETETHPQAYLRPHPATRIGEGVLSVECVNLHLGGLCFARG